MRKPYYYAGKETGRSLSVEAERALTAPPDYVLKANREHDQRYGFRASENLFASRSWVPGFVPACPKPNAKPEDIWNWHRNQV